MNSLKTILICISLSLAICNKLSLMQSGNSTSPAIDAKNAKFDFDLFKLLARNSTSLVISPFGIYNVLALATNGANGITQREMNLVIDKTVSLSRIDMYVKRASDSLATLDGAGNSDFKLVNSIFTKTKPSNYILSIAKSYFRARVDLLQNATQINAFVSNSTNGKIDNVIDQPSVDAARMVLVNAIYFRSSWMYPFDNKNNTQGSFKIDDTNARDCVFMNNKFTKGKVSYLEDDDMQILRLPYKNLKLSAVIILPKKMPLNNLIDKINVNSFRLNVKKLDSKWDIMLTMPRFRVEFQGDIKDALNQMGMKLAFTDKADFSRMTNDKAPLYIDKILHKTFLEVSETGTEAAAATAVIMNLTSSPPLPDSPDMKKMTLDRPFLFMITHDDLDELLFVSKVVDF